MWKTEKEVDISRERINFCSTSDEITRKMVEMGKPINGGSKQWLRGAASLIRLPCRGSNLESFLGARLQLRRLLVEIGAL